MGKDLKARKEYVWKKQIQNFVLSLLRHALIYIYIYIIYSYPNLCGVGSCRVLV